LWRKCSRKEMTRERLGWVCAGDGEGVGYLAWQDGESRGRDEPLEQLDFIQGGLSVSRHRFDDFDGDMAAFSRIVVSRIQSILL
jgi:hypothetical protein